MALEKKTTASSSPENTTVVSPPESTENQPPQKSDSPKSTRSTKAPTEVLKTVRVLESLKSSGGLVKPSSTATLETLHELNGGSNGTTTTAAGAVKSNGGGDSSGGASNGGSNGTAAGAVKSKGQPVGTFAASDPCAEALNYNLRRVAQQGVFFKYARHALHNMKQSGSTLSHMCMIASLPLGLLGLYITAREFEREKMEDLSKKVVENAFESKVLPLIEAIQQNQLALESKLLPKIKAIQQNQLTFKSKVLPKIEAESQKREG